ncbi:hypothetical protein BJQ89_01955 [Arthrobacter sp. ES1]|nr:hypothetical protein [Arthrobacter sp. ES1]
MQGNTAGYNVARGQFGVGVVVRHKAVARGVEQHGAFPADRLGNKQRRRAPGDLLGRQGGGVELEELQVPDGSPRPPGEGQAVGRGDGGVTGPAEKPSGAARGQEDRAGVQLPRPATGQVLDAGNPGAARRRSGVGAFGAQPGDEGAGLDPQPSPEGTLEDSCDEGAGDAGTRRVAAGVQDAGRGMRRFEAEGRAAAGSGVEVNTKAP